MRMKLRGSVFLARVLKATAVKSGFGTSGQRNLNSIQNI